MEPDEKQPAPASGSDPGTLAEISGRQLRFGWWSLLLFLTLGFLLEILHGFKVGWYLDVGNETRRLMFTLAHAHGTLFSLVNIAFGATARFVQAGMEKKMGMASPLYMASTILIPGGFFLGGVWIYDGDPGLGIFLVPPGVLCLFIAVLQTARACGGATRQS